MIRVGITGGIGSGKSTICSLFEQLDIRICYTDKMVHVIQHTNLSVISEIKEVFGDDIYTYDDGVAKLNKKKLASIIFSDKEKLRTIEEIIRPRLWEEIQKIAEEEKEKGQKYFLIESAIFFETGGNKNIDYMIGVTAPLDIRIERACKRDNATRETIEERINNQMPDDTKMALCDYVIINDGKRDTQICVNELNDILSNQN